MDKKLNLPLQNKLQMSVAKSLQDCLNSFSIAIYSWERDRVTSSELKEIYQDLVDRHNYFAQENPTAIDHVRVNLAVIVMMYGMFVNPNEVTAWLKNSANLT